MGLDKTSKSPRKTRNKVIRISFASLKLPTLQFIKHILGPREPITESLPEGHQIGRSLEVSLN
jgi:hypothetical protein